MGQLLIALLLFLAFHHESASLTVEGDDRRLLIIEFDDVGATLSVRYKGRFLTASIGYGRNVAKDYFAKDNPTLQITPIEHGFKVRWETNDTSTVFKDCIHLNGSHWYGGPQRKEQYWPLEKMTIKSNKAYVLKQLDNFSVAEYYWLSSIGAYIHVNERTPLWVDQNNLEQGKLCFIANATAPYINRKRVLLEYDIILEDNAKEAHLSAVKSFLGKPTGHPDPKMVKEPIFTTWAKYKWNISDSVVLQFANDISAHGFKNGQIEIDDAWEKCYGHQAFDTSPAKFADIKNTVKTLKGMGYRVTLWVHPFVDSDCQPNSNEGIQKGYFVKDVNGNTKGTWWNGNDTHQIDFTNPEAAEWYSARLRKLQEDPGIDAFKFDAGETDYGPQPSVYPNIDQELAPNALSQHYVETCSKFGNLIEVRSAWRTQHLPMFVRMIDKDSNWGIENGLYTLITTLLQMNMNGYGMVLPDMIGGNGYGGQPPDAELLVRWTQANTFMPAMQFSYLPWDFKHPNVDVVVVMKNFVSLHANFTPEIIRAMEANIQNGTPVNPPIWWIAPEDEIALACDDEYLLGEKILVAPVYKPRATSRKVYLPKGHWKDGNSGKYYQGPTTIQEYPAPIDVLPWFINEA